MEITNEGASLKIVVAGSAPEYVQKSQIKIATVIKTNIIKIDIGEGPLGNIFFPYSGVTLPATATPADLAAAINAMLPSVAGSVGSASEAKQDVEISLLTTMNAVLGQMKNFSSVANDKTFYEPSMIDESGANIVYKGYAPAGTIETSALWAIECITNINGVEVHTWADGDRFFDNTWHDRESLIYK